MGAEQREAAEQHDLLGQVLVGVDQLPDEVEGVMQLDKDAGCTEQQGHKRDDAGENARGGLLCIY